MVDGGKAVCVAIGIQVLPLPEPFLVGRWQTPSARFFGTNVSTTCDYALPLVGVSACVFYAHRDLDGRVRQQFLDYLGIFSFCA